MAVVDLTTSWTTITTTDAEYWQVTDGTIVITTAASPAAGAAGIYLSGSEADKAIRIAGGRTVRVRAARGEASFIREAFA